MNIDYELFEACIEGDFSAVKKYIKQGADIHEWDGAALYWSAQNGHLEIVKYLIRLGADIHSRSDTPLRWAAEHGHLQVVNVIRKAAGNEYKCHKCIIRSTCLELCDDFRQY